MTKSTPQQYLPLVLRDALIRSIQGVVRAYLIAPTLLAFAAERQFRAANPQAPLLTILEHVIRVSKMAALPSLLLLVNMGIPLLFILTAIRANHPAIVCVAGVALTNGYLLVTMPVFKFNVALFYSCVVAAVAFAAAVGARSDTPLNLTWTWRKD